MQKVIKFMLVVLMVGICTSFTTGSKEKINWLSLAQLQQLYKNEPRPVLVDIYTDWCGWCKVMDRDTYANEKVATYINQHYYAVKLNAESKDTLQWNGKQYGYNADYRSNELAVFFLYGQMSYPSTVFLATIDAQPAPLAGYLKPKELEGPLKFFGGGAYKTQTFPVFIKSFEAAW